MTGFLGIYIFLALGIFVSAAMIAAQNAYVEDTDVARIAARTALLCWAWPLALLVGLPWLLWKLITWAR